MSIDLERESLYISYVPTLRQRKIQREGFNAFLHYGLNTFTDKEWGDGKVSPTLFNPTEQDTDQWIKAIADAGITGVILTCKHHDGFCLWPTATTEYSVKSSPYKNGNGDVVKEVSDSCRKFGLRFGVYLSPWDRNHVDYSSPKYNDIYCEQLTELLTNYGDIYCVWLDGACGAYMDGKEKQDYDFDRYFELIRKLQPLANISGCGPDVRWIGNEGGFARVSEWNVVPYFACDIQTIESNSQQSDDAKFATKGADIVNSDLGSRKFLANYDKFMWYPAEVDVSIRPGWFYHKWQDKLVRSLENLLKIYYTSYGGNSLLLLNIPPDRRGLLHENDVQRLKELGDHIKQFEKDLLKIKSITAPVCEKENIIENVLNADYDRETYEPINYYTPKQRAESYEIYIELEEPTAVNRVKIVENTVFSQRVEKFEIYANVHGKNVLVYNGTTIGYSRIAVFKKGVITDKIIIKITECRDKPYIEFIGVFKDNNFKLKKVRFRKIKEWIQHKNYKVYIERENKNYEKYLKTLNQN